MMNAATPSLRVWILVCAGLVSGRPPSVTAETSAPEPKAAFLLVANKGDQSLSIVDLAVGRQIAVVQEDGETGHEVAASPDGKRAFVPIYGSAGVGQKGSDGRLIRVIDLQKRSVVATIDFGRGVRPHCPVFGPRNGLLYVTTELDNAVAIIDPVTLGVIGSIPTGHPQSHMLAIARDGRRGYTANVGSGTVSVLDLDAKTLVASIPVSALIQRISLSVDDRWAFTADQTKLRIAVIDTATNTVRTSIPLPGVGFGTTPTPDGRSLLVALPGLSMIALADLGTMKVVRTLELPKSPQEIRVSPDGSMAYVSCSASKKVAVIDLGNWRLLATIDVGPVDDGLSFANAP
jgi:YVTN family beta-propeller protein